MKSDFDAFCRALGSSVRAVRAAVSFCSVERNGNLAWVSVEFHDGRRFALGCSGDGSVFVRRTPAHATGDPPGFTTLMRDLINVGGILESVRPGDRSLTITVAGQGLTLSNLDDELSVTLNGRPLDPKVLRREPVS